MTSINNFINKCYNVAIEHPQLQGFGFGPLYNQRNDIQYPLLWITTENSHTVEWSDHSSYSSIIYTFTLRVADLVNNQENVYNAKGENANNGQEIISDTFQILIDVINYIKSSNYFEDYKIQDDISIDPFFHDAVDDSNGHEATINIKIKNNNTCDNPLNETSTLDPGDFIITREYDINLDDLNDVSIFTPLDGNFLIYNSTTQRWENSNETNYLSFDTEAAHVVTQGQLAWNADEETLDLGLNGAVLQLGQEVHYHVRNNTGSDIGDGVPVYATGTLGASGRITIAPFTNNNTIPQRFFIGITTETIAAGDDGKVTHFGKIRGINTNDYNEGDLLYLSSTIGELTNIQPEAPNIHEPVAIVISKKNNGTIFIRVPALHYLGDITDVYINSPLSGQNLIYDTIQGRWENVTLQRTVEVFNSNSAIGETTGFVEFTGNIDIVMPDPTSTFYYNSGVINELHIKNIGVGVGTLLPNGGEVVEKTIINSDEGLTLYSNGTDWRVKFVG